MKLFILYIFGIAALFSSCKKETADNPLPDFIFVKGAVDFEVITTSAGTFKYWRSTATIDKMVIDTAWVIVQWDAYSAPGSYEATLRDTLMFLPYQSGTIHHRSRTVYMHPWFASDVKVNAAWDKHGKHNFKW